MTPALANSIADQDDAIVEKMLESDRLAKARALRKKALYYKKKYGEDFEPEFDEQGKFKEPLYPPKPVLEEDDVRIVQQPLINPEETEVMLTGEYAHLNGTTSVQIARLLKRLNIEHTIKLDKKETMDLLSVLLMCNEKQLNAMASNNKIPAVIRIIIKALQNDIKIGSLDTVEKLWDRVFGKPTQTTESTATVQSASPLTSLIPGLHDKPMSREAYIMIKERIIGE